MKLVKTLFRYLVCLPSDLISWTFLSIVWLFFGTKPHWDNGFWFEFKSGSWPMRTWFKRWRGTTLCHGGWLAPGMTGTLIEDHEQVHVEQYETAGLIFGTYTFMWFCFEPELWFWGLASWAVMPFLFMLSGFAIAWLRGEDPYRGSVNEEAAYAITEKGEKSND